MNARSLTAEQLPRNFFDVIVVDVAFISLRLVLPSIWPLLDASNVRSRLVALVKPQFEVGHDIIKASKGVVRDRATQLRVLTEMMDFARRELDSCAVIGAPCE